MSEISVSETRRCPYCGLELDEGITRCAACGASEEDSPWTFYFNGEAMPKWTSTWLVIPNDHREGEDNDWIEDLYWRIWCRIDHLGSIETENSDLLRGCPLVQENGLCGESVETLRYSLASLIHPAEAGH